MERYAEFNILKDVDHLRIRLSQISKKFGTQETEALIDHILQHGVNKDISILLLCFEESLSYVRMNNVSETILYAY